MGLLGEEDVELPMARPGVVRLGATHSSSGNPNRFQTGDTVLRRDDEWRRSMPRYQRMIVSMLTGIQWWAYCDTIRSQWKTE